MLFEVRRSLVSAAALAVVIGAGAPVYAQVSAPMSVPPPGMAASEQIPMLKDVGVDQRLNERVPLDLPFVDENGRDVRLGDFFHEGRPVVLALVYFECPMLCTQVLNGMAGSFEALSFTAGQEFEIVAVSFDPGETPAAARAKRETYLKRYGRQSAGAGVHFLTGRPESIDALTKAVGFRYAYDPAIDQYAHPAALTVLTPEGRVSKYLFGIEFAPRDLKLALVEAAGSRIGSAIDQVLLFCYHYDPTTGKYGLAITNLIRAGGVATILALGAFIVLSLRRERRQANAVSRTATTGTR